MIDGAKLQRGELKGIAKVLLKMQEDKNGGAGVDTIQRIARFLKKGQIDLAINTAKVDSDKLWPYPDLRRFIHDVIYPIGYIDPDTGLLVNED